MNTFGPAHPLRGPHAANELIDLIISLTLDVRAPADGYTLLLVGGFNAVNATFYDKLNYNFIRDIAPVASIIRTPFVMAVNPTGPANTVPEFIAYAKTSPGQINYASAGTGTSPHRRSG